MDRTPLSNFPYHALFWAVFAMVAVLLIVGAAGIYGGYNVAADEPHSAFVTWLADTTRRNSIAAHARGIDIPAGFGGDVQIRAGAAEYGEMCSSCHLGPGVELSEISQGLYPRAPELARGSPLSPEQEFWVVKHGIKMTGMPAWGTTHSDEIIWSIVAFLRKLPSLSPDQYRDLTKDAATEHNAMKNMPGMPH